MGREALSQQGQLGRGQQAGGLGLPEGVTLEARLGLALSELQRLNARIDTLERGRAAETGAAAGQQAGGPAEAMVRELEAAGGAHQPFVRDPMGVTNATAGAVPGLNDLANRLLRASGTMPLGTAVPVRIAGLPGGAAATGQAGVAAAGLVQYIMADAQLLAALSEGGFTVRDYDVFRDQMLRLAERVDLTTAGDWLLFLQLDRKLRVAQHRDRLPWDHQAGCMDSMERTLLLWGQL
ncbi:hypothetical protein ABPG75_013463 [Micractinium tetrahymenae]